MDRPTGDLTTERLVLRLVDPNNSEHCRRFIRVLSDPSAGLGGNAQVGIKTVKHVQAKHKRHMPKQELCTKAPAPPGMIHLVYLKPPEGKEETEDDLIGLVSVSFRSEMPYPDLGYAFYQPHWGRGYASEAGRAVTSFWRDEVGVKEMFIAAMDNNVKSQRVAEKCGFVRAGGFDVVFGISENQKCFSATAYVLPGMEWCEWKADGSRTAIYPTVGTDEKLEEIGDIAVP
ncbi:Uu.00g006480.m01.CDS01 [Anthostomella pinea]|uniref:Uu.00g006480.m01.CDS01 n=1 Tax=Anthostomella pinea TaxID=933095 RepID=A0AAI8VF00_9PEZI|nr:Uu.00g006480.m01.CDS01 [Anthostomella pinea]